MQIKITNAMEIWSSPDGQRQIFCVQTEDKQIYKTWSKTLGTAESGTTYDIEIYTKQDNRGQDEQWIKQANKGGYGGGRSGGRSPQEQSIIMRQCALKAAVELAKGTLSSGTNISSKDVLRVAEKFNKWLHADMGAVKQQPEPQPKPQNPPDYDGVPFDENQAKQDENPGDEEPEDYFPF